MAAKAVILTVDDDPQVLAAVARDLRREYGGRYRVVRADSGAAALDTLRELLARGEPVALLLTDQRMPHMSGVAFLNEAATLYPDAKRALLTAYADTDAAIAAINQSRIHYYLMKPWDPPEDQLYPVVNDLLADWEAGYVPVFEGLRVLGHRWSPLAHQIRDFLARNQVPYRWVDVERDGEASALLQAAKLSHDDLPAVLFGDGTHLVKPDPLMVATRAGLKTRADNPFYDVVIVGAGPAGLASAVYGASEGLKVVLIDGEAPGGQAGTSSRIENYLGFPVGLSGGDLTRRAVAQARKFGAEIIAPQRVTKVTPRDPYRLVTLADGSELSCYALIISTGVSYRRLGLPGIEKLEGAGIYYGFSISEAMACQGEDVYIVGAGNSAGQAALYLSRYARSVHLLVRGRELGAKMSQYLVDQLQDTANVEVHLCSQVGGVQGEMHLEALTLADQDGNLQETVATNTLFVFIGAAPRTDWLEGLVARDRYGFIPTGPDLGPLKGFATRAPFLTETSVPGIFAAGDVRSSSVKRVASAVGEGSITIQFVHQYLAAIGAGVGVA